MPDNTGYLLLAGLGALVFLGRGSKSSLPAEDDTATTTAGSTVAAQTQSVAGQAAGNPPVLVVKTSEKIGAGSFPTETELAVLRSEQVNKQAFNWAAGIKPTVSTGPKSTGPSGVDLDAVGEIASRPTSTAIPVWNNRVGWYWVKPTTGLPVGPGGVTWPAIHMGSKDVLIGSELPSGWVTTGGGSARLMVDEQEDLEL